MYKFIIDNISYLEVTLSVIIQFIHLYLYIYTFYDNNNNIRFIISTINPQGQSLLVTKDFLMPSSALNNLCSFYALENNFCTTFAETTPQVSEVYC